ncbi:beta-lactamase [Sphingomonas sp. SRS2]|nr:beta-lactamase [Sphingomonas sp. SRS2]
MLRDNIPATSSDTIAHMVDTYAGKLMPGQQVQTFRNTDVAFSTRRIARGADVRPLQYADLRLVDYPIPSGDKTYDLYDYVSRNRIGGLLVMHGGALVLEQYELGLDPSTRWLSMSMAKSVSTTLVGLAIQDGFIESVDDLLTRYLPKLVGSAYDGVTIRELMQMTSGVHWDDTHTEPKSERRRMLELQIGQQPGAIMDYMAELPRSADPGSLWNYSTGETHVVGAIVHAATGQWLSDYLSARIWSRLGMESDATWWLEAPGGLEVAGSGIAATLRDYGRFAAFLLADGVIDGERVLPEGWVSEAGAPREVGGRQLNYGYMWWAVPGSDGSMADGAFSARGIFGQFMYINPARQVAIVVLSSRSKPKGAEAIIDNDFFNATLDALR